MTGSLSPKPQSSGLFCWLRAPRRPPGAPDTAVTNSGLGREGGRQGFRSLLAGEPVPAALSRERPSSTCCLGSPSPARTYPVATDFKTYQGCTRTFWSVFFSKPTLSTDPQTLFTRTSSRCKSHQLRAEPARSTSSLIHHLLSPWAPRVLLGTLWTASVQSTSLGVGWDDGRNAFTLPLAALAEQTRREWESAALSSTVGVCPPSSSATLLFTRAL